MATHLDRHIPHDASESDFRNTRYENRARAWIGPGIVIVALLAVLLILFVGQQF